MDLQHMENGTGGGGGGGLNAIDNNSATNDGLSDIDFQRMAQTIATSIQKISQNVSAMLRMVGQVNTPQESPELKKQLHQIMTYTHQLVSDTNNQFQEIDNCKDRHLKIQRDRLVDEFTTAITAFQSVQRKTVDIEKNAVRQARANTSYNLPKPPGAGAQHTSNNGNNNSFFEDNFFNRKSNQQNQQQQQQLQTQMQDDIDLQALEEQEHAIRELEQNIVGVNEIYKKLGAMVYEQGLTVDSIESNVEQTSVFVSQGSENLRKASSYKTKARKKKLILLGIVSIILLLVILVLVLKFN